MKIDKYNLAYSQKSSIAGTQEVDVNLNLNNNTTDTTGGVTGIVTDINGVIITGATVKIFDQSFTPFAHSITVNDGSYAILNVPSNNYKINCTALGYLYGESKQVFIPQSDLATVNFTLEKDPNYGQNFIAGLLYVEGTKTAIAAAKILVHDSANTLVATTTTADDGEFIISNLADGTYTVTPVLVGYDANVVYTFTVQGGNIYNVILYMINIAVDSKGTYTGQILNTIGVPIQGALVCLYSITENAETNQVTETMVSVTYTNAEGRYMFGNVEAGNYVVKAKNVTTADTTTVSTSSTTSTSTTTTSAPQL